MVYLLEIEMKSWVLLLSFLITTTSFADNADTAAKTIIRAYGYTCDTVDSIQPFLTGNGYHVYCSNFRYHFEIHDQGGKIIVMVK
jgi:hypothetical protein